MNRALIPFVALLVGCFGAGRGASPDASPESTSPLGSSAETTPAETAPAPAPADGDVALALVPDEVRNRLPLDLVVDIQRARGRFDSAESSADVAAAWRAANALAPKLEEALQPAYDSTGQMLELGWLTPSLPGMSETYMAEGTAIVFVLDAEPWKALAEKTPESEDDAFFALMERAWGSARPMGWPAWTERTWDYGGCSALGHGVIVEVLTLVDAASAAGATFSEEIAKVRADALGHVLQDDELFPRCDPRSLEPTDSGAIREEIGRIVVQIQLSDPEKAALIERQSAIQGQPHTGG